MHSAEFKAKVLAQCAEPGASVAGVALANGLNANVVRNWLVGRGLKRTGLSAPGKRLAAADSTTAEVGAAAARPVMRFVPVEVARGGGGQDACGAPGAQAPSESLPIEVELRRGAASLTVRWPASQAAGCAAWMREVAGALFKG